MRITSIDIETTGLNPDKSQILQVGAVVFDTSSEKFNFIATYNKLILTNEIKGEPFAIQMNARFIKKISDLYPKYKKCTKELQNAISSGNVEQQEFLSQKLEELRIEGIEEFELAEDFSSFLISNEAFYIDANSKQKFNVAGKNFAMFDSKFLEKVKDWKYKVHFNYRILDPGNMYVSPKDDALPTLEECKKRCIEHGGSSLFNNDSTVTHDALDDAMDVAKLIWYYFKYKESLVILKS